MARLKRELALVTWERDFLKEAALSSMDRCSTIEIPFDMEGVAYGTIRPSWSFEFSESGGVGAMEAGKVVERHGLCPGPARRFDPRHYRCQRRNRPAARATVSPGPHAGGARRDFAKDCRGLSIRCMAAQLGWLPSTVSREIVRHGGRSRYYAAVADDEAWTHACRPKPCRLAFHPILQRTVADKLSLK